jgi:CP family cyanate transporter-like MFS transporter
VNRRPALLAAGVLLVAANLRPALASVGPVLTDVRDDLGLSSTSAALLTTLPVLCLGLLAPLAPRLGRRFGIEPVLGGVLALLVVALLARLGTGTAGLFVGTAVAAGAIAVANVLVPAFVKREFPGRTGVLMGAYTMALAGSAAVAAGLTVPLAGLLGGGWRAGLGVWAVPAVVTLALWLPAVRSHTAPPASPAAPGATVRLLRSPLAWQVTAFLGLQALGFYAVLAWLPTVYQDQGWSAPAAGVLLSVSVLVQMPVSLLLPVLATRARDQRLYAVGTALASAAGLLGVVLAPGGAWLWAVLLGIGQGGSFALALTLLVLRAATTAGSARLSALAQTVGYTVAAAGPLLLGLLHDASGGWDVPLLWLVALTVVQLVTGVLASRARTVAE